MKQKFIFIFLVVLFAKNLFSPKDLFSKEPTIQQVQAEAIRYLGMDTQDMDSWKSRSRWSAALPRLQASFQRDLKDLISLSSRDSVSVSGGDVTVGPTQNNFDQNFNQGTAIDIKAVWYLNELVFNKDSLAVSSEKRDWMRERNRVLQDVSEAFFTHKRLVKELKSKSDPLEIREKKKFMLDQVNGTLDALTGGWFSKESAL
ncbi:MAG: hypothetical protein IPJ69_10800 [Deltaproteobacteria bacterium]|nr:MAG: hypothetical protein IPJ69_10800 [Deltaproteobacteria bacterium]